LALAELGIFECFLLISNALTVFNAREMTGKKTGENWKEKMKRKGKWHFITTQNKRKINAAAVVQNRVRKIIFKHFTII